MLRRSSSFVNRSRLKILVFIGECADAENESDQSVLEQMIERDNRRRYIEMEMGTASDD